MKVLFTTDQTGLAMRSVSNNTEGILSGAVRLRLQRDSFQNADNAARKLRDSFAQQHVSAKGSRVRVTKEDGSVVFAVLYDGRQETNWIESAVNVRMTTK